jgi:hypothetical protein
VSISSELPYVDEHATTIAAPRGRLWSALSRYAATLGVPDGHPLGRVLGTEPQAGFEVKESIPETRLTLTGRHRFSRYALVFELADAADDAVLVRAKTYAVFPGLHGKAYRTLVIGTRLHVLATNHMLRTIRRLSLEPVRS